MSFRKIKNPKEFTALVEQFLTAREKLKQQVRENKLGVSEAEFQQTQIQKPTISAIKKLSDITESQGK